MTVERPDDYFKNVAGVQFSASPPLGSTVWQKLLDAALAMPMVVVSDLALEFAEKSVAEALDRPHVLRRIAASFDLTILACFLLGTAVRAWALDAYPPGLHQDEVSSAYDAFALLHYGIDRNGFHNPVAFVAWGSGMSALTSYAMMPFIAVLGPTAVALRLPFLLAGAVSILLVARLVREIHGIQVARVAAFLMAVCPWHVLISRWGHEANLVPFVLLSGILVAVLSLKRPWLLSLSFAILGLDLYTYGTAYVALPILLALVIPYAVYHGRWRLRPLVAAVSVLGLVCLPAAVYALVNLCGWDSIMTPWFSVPHLSGVPRFETVGNFRVGEPQFFYSIVANFVVAARILIMQDDGYIWNVAPGYGLMYLFSMPLAVWGFVLLCRECIRREFTPAYFVWAWCITTAAQAIFILPNIGRFSLGVVPLVYCTALGLSFFRNRFRIVFYGLLVAYGLSFVTFTWDYFTTYAAAVGPRAMLNKAIEAASRDPDAKICVTETVGIAYIYVLWVNQEDPRDFLRTAVFANPGAEFQSVASFGRYTFGLPTQDRPEIDVYLICEGEAAFSPEMFQAEKYGHFLVLRRKNDRERAADAK